MLVHGYAKQIEEQILSSACQDNAGHYTLGAEKWSSVMQLLKRSREFIFPQTAADEEPLPVDPVRPVQQLIQLFTLIGDRGDDDDKMRAAHVAEELDGFCEGFLCAVCATCETPTVETCDVQLRVWSGAMEELGCEQQSTHVQHLAEYLTVGFNSKSRLMQGQESAELHAAYSAVLAAAVCAVAEDCIAALTATMPQQQQQVTHLQQTAATAAAIQRVVDSGIQTKLVRCCSIGLPEATGTYATKWADVFVFDSAIDHEEAQQLYSEAAAASYRRVEFSVTKEYRHSVVDHPVSQFVQTAAGRAMQRLAAGCFPSSGLKVYRTYTNAMLSSDVSFVHRDVDVDSDGVNVTVLMYPIDGTWDPSWGGETVFLDSESEIVLAVLPKPGRVVLFDSRVQHVGRVPSSLFRDFRFSLAMKLSEID